MKITLEDFTRINSDIYGNPRYVLHFLNVVPNAFKDASLTASYNAAVDAMRPFGGTKYRAKAYGGGIVFQSYDLRGLVADINKAIEKGL